MNFSGYLECGELSSAVGMAQCPLFPRKQTSPNGVAISKSGHHGTSKRTSASCPRTSERIAKAIYLPPESSFDKSFCQRVVILRKMFLALSKAALVVAE